MRGSLLTVRGPPLEAWCSTEAAHVWLPGSSGCAQGSPCEDKLFQACHAGRGGKAEAVSMTTGSFTVISPRDALSVCTHRADALLVLGVPAHGCTPNPSHIDADGFGRCTHSSCHDHVGNLSERGLSILFDMEGSGNSGGLGASGAFSVFSWFVFSGLGFAVSKLN